MKASIIIPARYQSSRFPGKPLALLDDKPMIRHVFERASMSSLANEVIVATDDERILQVVNDFGGTAIMTDKNHASGTDRCNEVMNKITSSPDIVVNVQGDEPFIDPELIDQLIMCFKDDQVQIVTAIRPITEFEDLKSPNVVKTVIDNNRKALYFSRQAIPFYRDKQAHEWLQNATYFQHIGIYAYRSKTLAEISKLAPSMLENAESLEQLRWIESGFSIFTVITDYKGRGIDSPDDVSRLFPNE